MTYSVTKSARAYQQGAVKLVMDIDKEVSYEGLDSDSRRTGGPSILLGYEEEKER